MTHDFDILIAGGGMVGAGLAALLAGARPAARIGIVERFPAGESPWQPSFDTRATALSSGSVAIFQRIGLWPRLREQACAISSVHVSQRGHWGSTTLHAHEHGMDALGYVVENAWLGRCLLAYLRGCANVSILSPAQVQTLKSGEACAQVAIERDGKSEILTAQLCVIADGADSALSRALGITSRAVQYQQTAIIATVATQRPHNGVAYERFTDTTPLAMLPLNDAVGGEHRSALVLTLPDEDIAEWRDASDDQFLKLLQQRFGQRLGKLLKVGSRTSYPLRLTQSDEQARANIVVLGNAAHSLHPVAGQGFNLALRDADALTEILSGAIAAGKSCGDAGVLASYQQRQQQDQQRTILFSDGLPKLFALPQLPMIAGRVAGLVGLDLLMPAQKAFVRFAAGLGGREARP